MAWPTPVVWINDNDLTAFKFQASLPKGFMSAPGVSDQLVNVPSRYGSIRTSKQAQVGPRRFTVQGVLRAATATEADTLWARLKQYLSQERLEIRFAAWPDLIAYARYEGVEWQEVPGFNFAAGVLLTFSMANPLKYSREPNIYAIASGAEVALDLGSASSDVDLTIIGTGASDPTVYYRDAQGTVRGVWGYAVLLAGGEWIEVDGTWGTSYLHAVSGAVSNAGAYLSESIRPFSADPNDGDATQGPTLQAINCRVVARLTKAWL